MAPRLLHRVISNRVRARNIHQETKGFGGALGQRFSEVAPRRIDNCLRGETESRYLKHRKKILKNIRPAYPRSSAMAAGTGVSESFFIPGRFFACSELPGGM